MAEIVTREMVLSARAAYARAAYDGAESHPMRAALLAVAPLIRRAALEEAAAGYDARAAECCRDADACDAAGDADNAEVSRSLASHHSLTAAELRALAEKQP